MLESFPNIEIIIKNSNKPYILRPKNYFYREIPDDGKLTPGVDKFCMALKGEEDDKLILGAFSMMDHYVYFDRLDKQVKVYEENCYLRTKQILLKKERILEAIPLSKRLGNKNALFLSIIGVASCAYLLFSRKKKIN